VFLDLPCPRTEVIDAVGRADDSNSNLLGLLAFVVRSIKE
jgi:hypothetical protein